jgi:glutamine amidotransferase
MCLLTFLPAGVMPDVAELWHGTQVNTDGHGFALVDGGRLMVRRGMDADRVLEEFVLARHRRPHGPALFHSRLGTHGGCGVDNCHPFAVGGDARTVVAHNGILPATVRPRKGDRRSDTRIAAEDFLPAFGSLRLRRTRLRLERWMTPHNKMVILTVDRRFKQRSYILNERSGLWDGGTWYSNDGYLPAPPRRWPQPPPCDTTPGARRALPDVRCERCGFVLDPMDDACPDCGWCLDCGEMPADCWCYAPALDGWAGRSRWTDRRP